jgi:hypothetical protein
MGSCVAESDSPRFCSDSPADPRTRALVAAALGCLNAAVDVWTAAGGTLSLPGLLDQAMSALTGQGRPHGSARK